ncbi:MAG: DUF6582 domain-containing protein [Candidatus Cybelea sp.]
MKATCEPHFAFPAERKEPLTGANHVRNALARFDQTIGDHGVNMSETGRHQLGSRPRTQQD